MTNVATAKDELWGHPKGLYVLFFTELWERFSYYGMRAILVLYMISSVNGDNPGFGWDEIDAISLYGSYTALVYILSILGGWVADKFWGQKKTVLIGGILLCLGHGVLAVDALWAFYTGLALIILGVGGLKPNISTMVGGLYKSGDDRRDKGFTIFYIGINIGAFLSALVVGGVAQIYGWHYGFGLAGIGMVIGQAVFMWGNKYLEGIGEATKDLSPAEAEAKKRPLTSIEIDRMKVMGISFLLIIVFWGAFEQAGGLMNIYTAQKTDLSLSFSIPFIGDAIPASWFQSVNAFFIITLGVPIAAFWYNWKKKGKESSSIFKMAIGVIIMGWGFLFMSAASMQFESEGSSAMYWLVLAYLFHTVGELCASPVALSFITKLAPLKYASLMMGAYFASTGVGNYVAGLVGQWSQSAGELEIFTGIAIFCTAIALLVIALLKPLKRLTHGAENTQEGSHNEEAEGFELADKPSI
ncbi:MAG: POT family proton-dependent oligopeptide transporter [Vicingaceae bacterium]|jgi:POT family proton-dependent oligopeptide transporter